MSASSIHLPGRNLLILFDGTSNSFSSTNSNVLKLFSFLVDASGERKVKDDQKQRRFYNSGVGTYTGLGFVSGLKKWVAEAADNAYAW